MKLKLEVLESKELVEKQACSYFCDKANEAINKRGAFYVALSGGSTPKNIYQRLAKEYKDALDWKKVHLFWSDERCVPLDHPDSNYKMAMDCGFLTLPILKENIHPFTDPDDYERLLEKNPFDLVLLGMGDDGHTASLFPKTHALHSGQSLAVKNFLPEKEVWRLTLTFKAINQARMLLVIITGKDKAKMLKQIMNGPQDPNTFPIQGIGKEGLIPLFLVDKEAASLLN
jgi:6-phosphogluconolactonase